MERSEPIKIRRAWRTFLILYAMALPASGAGSEELPRLDEQSAKGLQIQCSPAKTNFVVGEPVNLWCVITNTTDVVKPVAWHPSSGSHFCLAKNEDSWMTGILPQVLPQLDNSVRIRSVAGSPEYVLLLPPHSSLRLLLTHKPERSAKFRGIVVYDPLTHGGGFFGNEGLEKAKRACVFSREFEYEVSDSEKRR
jgi:hypothetical protein